MERKSGIIVKGTGGLYDILCGDGERISCRAKGIFRHESLKPTVGDRVTVAYTTSDECVIESIAERKSLLIRPPLANLDRLFILVPSRTPAPDYYTVDKLSAISVHNGIEPVIVSSKCSLDSSCARETADIYGKVFPVFVTDALSGEGVDSLKDFITEGSAGSISAFAGASGAGKSTLMNALFPSLSLSTGSVSERTGRGRHTTRTVELFEVGNNALIADTPGFTMLDFEQFDFFGIDDLPSAFPEIGEHIGSCRYTKCTHRKEEGCKVIEAMERGDIARSRHESYKLLYEILKNKHSWDKR